MELKVAVTGADGFIGRHLCYRLLLDKRVAWLARLTRSNWQVSHTSALACADVVFHLAAVMRPRDEREFSAVNYGLTAELCEHLNVFNTAYHTLVVFTSSIQATLDNPYGRSKRAAELKLMEYSALGTINADVIRLCNVFGPGAKVEYSSVVANFCYRAARGIPLQINDPRKMIRFIYVEDVVDLLMSRLNCEHKAFSLSDVPVGLTRDCTVGELAAIVVNMAATIARGELNDISDKFTRDLYFTYVSYLPLHDDKETK